MQYHTAAAYCADDRRQSRAFHGVDVNAAFILYADEKNRQASFGSRFATGQLLIHSKKSEVAMHQ